MVGSRNTLVTGFGRDVFVVEYYVFGKNGYEEVWQKRYFAGVMLLNLENPYKVVGIYRESLIVPEADYETKGGYRNNVIFPTGIILEDNGEVKIYYGAADTAIALVTASVEDLIELCDTPIER